MAALPRPQDHHDLAPVIEPDQRSAVDCFYDSIKDSEPAIELIEQVTALCEGLQVQFHHTRTNGGDLRVRANRPGPHPRERNVITMAWAPMKRHFSCQALLLPDECIEQGIPPDGARQTTDVLPTRLNVRPNIDYEAFLRIVDLSVQRFRGQ